ncbi:hypothetical protein RLEG12_08660 (plasmid) [Rhizobium leguminosarum bv. trifolii CB782]|nr:hypothetical protein RLEG12_08660 [Rhizobium leguminosarum bv. trifolii CB782]
MHRLDHRPNEERLLTSADALGRSKLLAYTGPTVAQGLGHGTDQTKDRFVFLDELPLLQYRWLSCTPARFLGFNPNSYAYLAVDFFFCLSGLVLANAYDPKLRSGVLRSPVFLLKRIVRLYPVIVAGVGLGVLALQVAYAKVIPLADVSILAVGALLLLPVGFLVGQEAFAMLEVMLDLGDGLAFKRCDFSQRFGTGQPLRHAVFERS